MRRRSRRKRPPRSDLPRAPQAALRGHRRAGRPTSEAADDRPDGATADDSGCRAGGSELLVDGHRTRQAQLLRHDAPDRSLGAGVPAHRLRQRPAEDGPLLPRQATDRRRRSATSPPRLPLPRRRGPSRSTSACSCCATPSCSAGSTPGRCGCWSRVGSGRPRRSTGPPSATNSGRRWSRTSLTDCRAYFRECRKTGGHISDPSDEDLVKAFRRYGTARFASLYRAWRRMGDPISGPPDRPR